jgi:hypothetical protein
MYRRESLKAESVNGDTKTSAGIQHLICKVEHIKDAIFSLQASVNKTAMPY